MHLKCNWCDTERQRVDKENGIDVNHKKNKANYRSINKETDSYVCHSKKYYHEECYRQKLKSGKKKFTDDEIEEQISDLKVVMNEEIRNSILRDKFYDWIKNHYQIPLPSYFVLRVDSIANGNDNKKKVYGKINYEEFLEMYEKLSVYLTKQTMNMNFKDTAQRMSYELAIVIGQYENYRRFKDNVAKQESLKVSINEKIVESNKFNEALNKARSQEDDDLQIGDIIDELI